MGTLPPGTPRDEPSIGPVRGLINFVIGTAIGWVWIISLETAAMLITDDEEIWPDERPEGGMRVGAGLSEARPSPER